MRRWGSIRMILSLLAAIALAALLAGCPDDDDDDDEFSGDIAGIDLTEANAAAVGDLEFNFADGAIFGFGGQACTLGFGADGTTFTLTCDDISGAIAFSASCTLTPDPANATFGTPTYTTCEVDVEADGTITAGSAFTADATLRLAVNVGDMPVASAPTQVTDFEIDSNGDVSRNGVVVGQLPPITGITGGESTN